MKDVWIIEWASIWEGKVGEWNYLDTFETKDEAIERITYEVEKDAWTGVSGRFAYHVVKDVGTK